MANKLKLTSLRQAREINGWSRQYVAEQVGVDLATIGRWERGERMPHPHYRQQICELFQKNALELGLHQKINSAPEKLSASNISSNAPVAGSATSPGANEGATSTAVAIREKVTAQSNRPQWSAPISLRTMLALFGGSLLFLDLLIRVPRFLHARH